MKNGFNDDPVRKTRFLARALSSVCVLAAGLSAEAATQPPPGARTAVPSIYYLGVSLTDIVVTYEKKFAVAGFSIKERTAQKLGDGTQALKRTFVLQTIKAPYSAEVTYVFQPISGSGKTLRIRVSRPNSAFAYGSKLDPNHEIEVQKAFDVAEKQALYSVGELIGSHQLHEFDSPDW